MEKEKKHKFGSFEAYYKLHYGNNGAAFYFVNPSESQTLTAEFNLTLTNLAMQDSSAGDNQESTVKMQPDAQHEISFKIVLQPKSEAFKVMLPIDHIKGRKRRINMHLSYKYSAKK